MFRRVLFCLVIAFITGIPVLKANRSIGAEIVKFSGNDCIIKIEKSLLDRDFTIAARVEALGKMSGRLKLSSGQRLSNPVWLKLKLDRDKLYFIKVDGKNLFEGSPSTSKAYIRNMLPCIWKEYDIISNSDSSFTVNLGKFFLELLDGVDPFQGRTMPGKLLSAGTKLINLSQTDCSIEASVAYSFEQNGEKKPVVVRKSLRVLPEEPMKSRVSDSRINYGEILKTTYNTDVPYIYGKACMTRFRLKPSRTMKNGELVQPEKQIVFYVDSCFPEKWKSAIKAGIEDWNRAFEQIGFRNVIKAVDYPKDKSFDEYASGINCFRYVVSDFPNAMGKYWADPRTGEILEADVLFYSSVVDLLKKWYFLQTASYNPLARNINIPDSVLSRLIRYASAHEVGHCLGLEHNFKASFAYETDSLRSKNFTDKYGSTPSIMDYARMNYVAQPGDGVTNVYPPYIGETDMYAIKIGYKYLEEENDSVVISWINEKQNDPLYRYDKSNPSAFNNDPSVMQTDIGNNPRISGIYGIRNLRYILKNISEWNPSGDNPFEGYPASYDDLMDCYFKYVQGMIPWIGGVYKGASYGPKLAKEKILVTSEESMATVEQILYELKEGYSFLVSEDVMKYEDDNTNNIISKHKDLIGIMLNETLFEHLAYTSSHTGYGIDNYLKQLSNGIFSLSEDNPVYKNIQYNYLTGIFSLLTTKANTWYVPVMKEAVYSHINWIKKKYKKNKTIHYYFKGNL